MVGNLATILTISSSILFFDEIMAIGMYWLMDVWVADLVETFASIRSGTGVSASLVLCTLGLCFSSRPYYVRYTLRCDMKRSLLAKDLSKTCEFMVHCLPQKAKLQPTPVDFNITPETLQNIRERSLLPKFLIRGHLDATNCVITQPLTGELVVQSSDVAIKSIELQLVRVETCGCAEGYARDATEIQNIQIAEGDVCHSLPIPIYMVFPRLFTCPTLETTNFKVEFEVNVVIVLHDDHLITENFPLKLCRV
ncbi:vacuolar protein sorting-associated protein 26C isoform X3 [Esox lucius]|uniref:vacuolar protein sorting-associated protein 26C isoform X3 n=1 Tax=Esox lucius TaxID=8010 RepID=UPI001476BF84|nr:vacuolar protein sorting-associated protein 26C isoform X3 [Esox lucius]